MANDYAQGKICSYPIINLSFKVIFAQPLDVFEVGSFVSEETLNCHIIENQARTTHF